MGMTMLASAIALGGVATLELVNPVSKARLQVTELA